MKAKGQIIDKITQEPLPRASVIITDNSGEIIDESKRATANDEGIFEIDVFPSDYLVISYVGYKNAKISINDFSSDIKVIPLTYIKSGEQTSDLFKEGRDENAQDDKTLQIKTVNQSTGEAIPHVTYFMKISNGDQLLLSDFFYSEDEMMILDIETVDSELRIIGDRQYDHNAFISGIEKPITIKGDIFRDSEEYMLEFELRTIYDKSNWVFSLDGLSVDIEI